MFGMIFKSTLSCIHANSVDAANIATKLLRFKFFFMFLSD